MEHKNGFRLASLLLLAPFPVAAGNATARQAKPLEPWGAPLRASKRVNPERADAYSVKVGAGIFERECVACHGAKGGGDGPRAADLDRRPGNLSEARMWDQTDGALFWKLTEGREHMPGTRMRLSDDERWHVINYVRTLAPADAAPTEPKFPLEEEARKALTQVVHAYEAVCAGLVAKGDGAAAAAAAQKLAGAAAAFAAVDPATLPEAARSAWLEDAKAIAAAAEALKSSSQDVPRLRTALGAFSTTLIAAIERYGHAEATPIFVFVAHVAGGQSLSWIQTDPKPRDPYGAGGDTEKQLPKRRLGGTKR
jgi:mono/diheme cytochrome c family protein